MISADSDRRVGLAGRPDSWRRVVDAVLMGNLLEVLKDDAGSLLAVVCLRKCKSMRYAAAYLQE